MRGGFGSDRGPSSRSPQSLIPRLHGELRRRVQVDRALWYADGTSLRILKPTSMARKADRANTRQGAQVRALQQRPGVLPG